MPDDLTPYGEIIERARGATSKRAAARAARISEGRWRQLVTGRQPVGGGQHVPARPRRETLIAMARAVQADVDAVLSAAGMAVGGDTEDAGYVAAPGDLVDQAVTNEQVLAEVRSMREVLGDRIDTLQGEFREDFHHLSRRVARLESRAESVDGPDGKT